MATNPNDVFGPLDMENNTSSPSGNGTPLEAPTPAFAASSAGQQEPFDPSSTRTSFTRVDHDHEHDGHGEQGLQPPLPTLTHISSSSLTPGASSDPESTVPADNAAAKASSLSSSQPPQSALTSPAPAAPSSSTMTDIQTHPALPLPAPTSTPTPESASASASIPILTSTPQVASAPISAVPQTPQTYLTFLLISGKRRTMAFDPETAIGRVKELAWNSWPADWQDDRPPAPSYLRVLYLGRMLQDDETLTKLKLPTYTPPTSSPSPSSASSSPSSTNSPGQAAQQQGPIPTIMHLSIRPYAPPNEGDGAFKKKRRRGTEDGSPSSGTNPNDTPGGQEAGCCSCVVC